MSDILRMRLPCLLADLIASSGVAVYNPVWSGAMSNENDRVYHSDPQILGGEPVFRGTRVPVRSLFDHLKAGDSIDEFLDGFPSVKREQVLSVLEEMQSLMPLHV